MGKLFSSDHVADHIRGNTDPEDYDGTSAESHEEVVKNHVKKHPKWELKTIPVNKLSGYHDMGLHDDMAVRDKTDRYKNLSSSPPAGVAVPHPKKPGKYYLIDGKHRHLALTEGGDKHMDVYVPAGPSKKAPMKKSENVGKVQFFHEYDLPEHVDLPDQHRRAVDVDKEVGENHRLNTAQDIHYAVKDNKVVGHVGQNEDGKVEGVYVDPEHRRQGIAEGLYRHVAKTTGSIKSDHPSAMEPGAKAMWEKMQSENPKKVIRSKGGYTLNKAEKLYHGSKADFDSFTKKGTGKHGLGFYFTPDKNEAHHFAHTLAGDGASGSPTIYHTEVNLKKPFNTMNVEHAKEVARHHGMEYKAPKNAGGPKEHYHHLEAQMKRAGKVTGPAGKSNFNDKIKEAGFDHVHYDLMDHKIAFSPEQIKIKHKEMAKSELLKAENMDQNMLYISVDGDGIGQMVGRAVLADDEQALHEVSNRIDAAQDYIRHAIEQMGGQIISFGGDEATAKIPAEGLDSIEALRKDIQHAYGFTITVGVGKALSEAAKSLLAGKTNGKDQIVIYSPEVDDQLKGMTDRLQNGEGSDEDKKISEAYLDPKEDDMKESEKEHDHSGEDCEYCAEADAQNADSAAPEEGDDHEHTGDDCEYCQEANEEQGPDEVGDDEVEGQDEAPEIGDDEPAEDSGQDQSDEDFDHEHSGDDCEYCQQADQDESEQPEDLNDESMVPDEEQEMPQDEGNPEDADVHTEEGVQQIADAIENEEDGNVNDMDQMDDTDMAIGNNVEEGVSRPDDYSDAGDHTLGLSEDEADDDQGPDLGSVLKDGLDSHAENIQKEKVSQMVGEALEGFKANKKILEMAQEQAPEFYQASIAMLKAMIEMAKMLGLGQGEEPEDDGSETEGQDIAQEEQEAPPAQAQTAPAQEGQQPPKARGQ